MAKKSQPAQATRLNRAVPLKVATDSQAKAAAEQSAAKANMKAMKPKDRPLTKEEKLKLAVAGVQIRDSAAFKKHTENRGDLPTRGIDDVSLADKSPDWSKHGKGK